MVGYVYFSGSLIINGKIDIVDYIEIDDNIKKIVGIASDNSPEQICFDGGSDYIILQTDSISKNIGDNIVLNNLIDCRDYFLKGANYWYQEQIKTSNETINNLKSMNDIYGSTLDYLMFNVLPSLVATESSSSS